jgi:hypothetical protein
MNAPAFRNGGPLSPARSVPQRAAIFVMHARIGMLRPLNRHVERVQFRSQRPALEKAEAEAGRIA